MRPVTRIDPIGPVGAYRTYAIHSPRDTAVRAACQDMGCLAYRHGWETVVDEATDLGKSQAAYIRTRSGRDFRESRTGELTVFRFDPFQRCFADHQTRPESYLVRDGDWRGNPTGRRHAHSRPADWLEDFGDHQLTISEQQKRG